MKTATRKTLSERLNNTLHLASDLADKMYEHEQAYQKVFIDYDNSPDSLFLTWKHKTAVRLERSLEKLDISYTEAKSVRHIHEDINRLLLSYEFTLLNIKEDRQCVEVK